MIVVLNSFILKGLVEKIGEWLVYDGFVYICNVVGFMFMVSDFLIYSGIGLFVLNDK